MKYLIKCLLLYNLLCSSCAHPRLTVLSPKNNSYASRVIPLVVSVSLDPEFEMGHMGRYLICLRFGDSNFCAVVNDLVFRRFLIVDITVITSLEIILCHSDKLIYDEDLRYDGSQCNLVVSHSKYIVLPGDESLLKLIESEIQNSLFENKTTVESVFLLSYTNNFNSALKVSIAASTMSPYLYILMPTLESQQKVEEICESVSVSVGSCCLMPGELCTPPVTNFAILLISSDTDWNTHLTDIVTQLSVVNGQILIVSDDLTPTDLMSSIPSSLTSVINLIDASGRIVDHSSTWSSAFFADLRPIWMHGDLVKAVLEKSAGFSVPQNSVINFDNFPEKSTASFSFGYDVNIASLQNVCVYANATTIVLINDAMCTGETCQEENGANLLLNDSLKTFLTDWSSGMFSTNPAGGWKFLEKSKAQILQDNGLAGGGGGGGDSLGSREILMFPGVTALASAPFSPNILHAAQVLLPLVHTVKHPELYSSLLSENIERFFLPTFFDIYSQQWEVALSMLVRSYVSSIQRNQSDQPSRVAGIYFLDDISRLLQGYHQNPSLPLVCFEKAVIHGHSNSFIPSAVDADAFRNYVYQAVDAASTGVSRPRMHPSLLQLRDDVCRSSDGNSDQGGSSSLRSGGGDGGLRVSVVVRGSNRWILNLAEILQMMEHEFAQKSKLSPGCVSIDMDWLAGHIVLLEQMSFSEQVQLMRDTDILIAAHGAALTNAIFLKPQSVVIEVLTAPWYQAFYDFPSTMFGVKYMVLPMTDLARCERCLFLKQCMDEMTLFERSSFLCFGMRQCSAFIDVDSFRILLLTAIRHVSLMKRIMAR